MLFSVHVCHLACCLPGQIHCCLSRVICQPETGMLMLCIVGWHIARVLVQSISTLGRKRQQSRLKWLPCVRLASPAYKDRNEVERSRAINVVSQTYEREASAKPPLVYPRPQGMVETLHGIDLSFLFCRRMRGRHQCNRLKGLESQILKPHDQQPSCCLADV